MGKKLSELNQQYLASKEEYLLIDKDNQNESYKIKLKDIDITNFLKGYLVNEIEVAKNELGGISLYDGIQTLFDNVPHTHFTNRITSNNTTQAPTVKAVYDYILENGGGGGGGTETGGSGIKEKVDNPKLWELTSGMYEVTSGFYYTIDNYQSLENTSAILFIGDDSPEQDINYFMIAGRIKYYGAMKIDGSDGTIVTEDFSNEEISESSTNKDIPSSKAVYDFVTNKTKIKRFNNPKLWELEEGWSYITQGFYYGEGENDYFALASSAVIYKPYNANTSCSFCGLGVVYNNQTNLISGSIDYVNNKWQGYCSASRFIEEINTSNPSNRDYPSEKAVVDFVTSYVNAKKQISIVQNPNLWELENGWYYIDSGFYLDENNYIELHPEALVYIYTNSYHNFYGWEINGTEFIGSIEDIDEGHLGTISKKVLTKTVNENSTDEQYPTAKSIFDFVKTETKVPTFENPMLWELKPNCWYYIYNGFYYGSDQYQTITDGMLFITGNIEWSYILITTQGKFWGTFKVENNKVVGTCNKELFTAQINIDSPTDEKYPSEKAVIDYVKEQINNLVDTAPETLNTLNELANALNNDENFASTVMEQIGKKIGKEAITTEVTNNSTDEQIASAKAMTNFVKSYVKTEKQIPVLKNAKLWELENGWYYIDTGFYYGEVPSIEESYQEVLSECLIYVYHNTNYNFYAWDKSGSYFYGSIVYSDEGYKGFCKKRNMTTEINENSTGEQYPSAKAVYDFVNNNTNKRELLETNASLVDLDTGIYETSYMKPINLTVSEEKEIILLSSTIYNQKDEIKDEEGNFIGYVYQGIIVGTYNINDGHNGVIFYCLALNANNEINISEFIDLNDDFIKRENTTKEISNNSNHLQIPTAKAVYEFVSNNTISDTREQLKTNTSLLDLNTGVYEVSYINPIILTISNEKEITLVTGTIFNQKDEVKDKDGNFFGYISQGIIVGTYSTDDGHNGVIFYCATINTEGVVTITEFTDLNEDFIKEENITKEISSSSTQLQIPTAKAVYENLEQKSQVRIITWGEND